MADFCLHKSTLGQFTKQLFELISTGKRYRIKISEWRDLRTIPMNATWRMWVATTGDWLRARGVVVDIRSRNGTVVLAHYRMAGICGTGMKPADLFGAWCCSSCHDEIDRRTRLTDAGEAHMAHLEGVIRTQAVLLSEGKVKA